MGGGQVPVEFGVYGTNFQCSLSCFRANFRTTWSYFVEFDTQCPYNWCVADQCELCNGLGDYFVHVYTSSPLNFYLGYWLEMCRVAPVAWHGSQWLQCLHYVRLTNGFCGLWRRWLWRQLFLRIRVSTLIKTREI